MLFEDIDVIKGRAVKKRTRDAIFHCPVCGNQLTWRSENDERYMYSCGLCRNQYIIPKDTMKPINKREYQQSHAKIQSDHMKRRGTRVGDLNLVECKYCKSSFAQQDAKQMMRRYGANKIMTFKSCPNCGRRIHRMSDDDKDVAKLKKEIERLQNYATQCRIVGDNEEYKEVMEIIQGLQEQISKQGEIKMKAKDELTCAYCGAKKKENSFFIGASKEPDWTMVEGTGKITCPNCYKKAMEEGQARIRAHVESVRRANKDELPDYVENEVIISNSDLKKYNELKDKGYKVLWVGENKICFVPPLKTEITHDGFKVGNLSNVIFPKNSKKTADDNPKAGETLFICERCYNRNPNKYMVMSGFKNAWGETLPCELCGYKTDERVLVKVKDSKVKDADPDEQQLAREIETMKARLRKTLIRENFGQKEVNALEDKWGDKAQKNPRLFNMIREFDNWCMNYTITGDAKPAIGSETKDASLIEEYKEGIICREGNGEFFFASKHIPKLWGESIPELKKKVDEEMKRKGLTEDSFKVEVTTKGDNGEYVSNALRFATQNEAEQYAKDLAWKWTAVLDYRVTSSSDPVNSKWESGHVISVDSKKSTAKDTATKEIKVIDQIAELEKQKEQAKKMGYGTDAYDIAIEGLRKQKDVLTQDPLTEKGEKILETMKERYGEEEGERVFYASKNAGKIKGVD